MTSRRRNSRATSLLVGAFERDNFGDELFAQITERYLHDAGVETERGAPFVEAGSPAAKAGILPWPHEVRERRFDSIWTVGGEMGGLRITGAYLMASEPDEVLRFRELEPEDRQEVLKSKVGWPLPVHAYIPDPVRTRANRFTPLIVNSVGLSGMKGYGRVGRREICRVLWQASHLAVRDGRSSEFLTEWGVAHRLAPDAVQVLPLIAPRPEGTRPDGPVLVQATAKYIDVAGLDAMAEVVTNAGRATDRPVQFFAAGTAVGHDSFDLYDQIAEMVHKLAPEVEVSTSHALDPWERIALIRDASLWIGTSLHGRIVASCYGVPRVSLKRAKVSKYAETWDPEMPYSVGIKQLKDAVAEALEPSRIKSQADRPEALAVKSHQNLTHAVDCATAGMSTRQRLKRVKRAAKLKLGIE